MHCEINPELSAITTHNFTQLKTLNIECKTGDSQDILNNIDKNWDWIYIDPSRRNESKGKVFMLKDCLPNVPENIDFYFTKSTSILIKTAPLLDLTAGLSELKNVKSIHIVALNNEVKELKDEFDIQGIPVYLARQDFRNTELILWLQSCASWVEDKTRVSFDDIYRVWMNFLLHTQEGASSNEYDFLVRRTLLKVLKASNQYRDNLFEWLKFVLTELDKIFLSSLNILSSLPRAKSFSINLNSLSFPNSRYF